MDWCRFGRTLAEADPWQGFEHIGKPVPLMIKRVKIWLQMGQVKIVTARFQNFEEAVPPIQMVGEARTALGNYKCKRYGYD